MKGYCTLDMTNCTQQATEHDSLGFALLLEELVELVLHTEFYKSVKGRAILFCTSIDSCTHY